MVVGIAEERRESQAGQQQACGGQLCARAHRSSQKGKARARAARGVRQVRWEAAVYREAGSARAVAARVASSWLSAGWVGSPGVGLKLALFRFDPSKRYEQQESGHQEHTQRQARAGQVGL